MNQPNTPTDGELSKSFEPATLEARWYREWEKRGYFAAGQHTQGGPAAGIPYAIQFPPPNVTGTLHMGHAFNQTIMDGLTRYYRMRGHNTAWIPGTDHAGIATQIVVERQLDAETFGGATQVILRRAQRGLGVAGGDRLQQDAVLALGFLGARKSVAGTMPGQLSRIGKMAAEEFHQAADVGVVRCSRHGDVEVVIRLGAVVTFGQRLVHDPQLLGHGFEVLFVAT